MQEAHVGSVMASYNEIDGVPVAREPLAARQGAAPGVGLRRLHLAPTTTACRCSSTTHHVALDLDDAARQALERGRRFRRLRRHRLPHSRRAGQSRHSPDGAARSRRGARACHQVPPRPLRSTRMSIPTTPSASTTARSTSSSRSKPRARSIVLLKNDKNLLPLDLTKSQDHRRHRPQCGRRASGRLQPRSRLRHQRARRHQARAWATRPRCSTPKDARSPPHRRASAAGGPDNVELVDPKTQTGLHQSRRRRCAQVRCCRSSWWAKTKAPTAKPGRRHIAAIAIRSTCSARRTTWSRQSSKPASP